MNTVRRALIAPALALLVSAGPAAAWPEKPLQIVVPFAAGTPPDSLARMLAEGFQRNGLGEVVVSNQPGAGGSLAVAAVARAAPDGHTLAVAGDAALVVNPWLSATPALEPLRELAPVSQLVITPTVLVVGRELPARSVEELVALARAKPGALSFASAGAGTSSRRNGELLRRRAGLEMIHVPYRTSPLIDVAEGRVSLFFANPATVQPMLADGRLRALAVAARQRLATLPSVPTMAETGQPGIDSLAWFGLVAPAGTPPEIVDRLHAEAERVLRDPALAPKLAAMGATAVVTPPAAFRHLIADELPRWKALVREAGIQAD